MASSRVKSRPIQKQKPSTADPAPPLPQAVSQHAASVHKEYIAPLHVKYHQRMVTSIAVPHPVTGCIPIAAARNKDAKRCNMSILMHKMDSPNRLGPDNEFKVAAAATKK